MDKIEKYLKLITIDEYHKIKWDELLDEDEQHRTHPNRDNIVQQAYKLGFSCVNYEYAKFPFIVGFKELKHIREFAYVFECVIGYYDYYEELKRGSVWFIDWLEFFETTEKHFNDEDTIYGISIQHHDFEEERSYIKNFQDHYFCLGKGKIERP